MNDKDKNKVRMTHAAVWLGILLLVIDGGMFLSQKNKEEEARRKDPYNILGKILVR